jgi:hypothetical protein
MRGLVGLVVQMLRSFHARRVERSQSAMASSLRRGTRRAGGVLEPNSDRGESVVPEGTTISYDRARNERR